MTKLLIEKERANYNLPSIINAKPTSFF